MKNKKGFLFFELIICIALFIITSFCIIAPYTIFHRLVLKSEIKALYFFFYYTQQKAIAAQEDISVIIDSIKNTYQLDGTLYTLHKNINFNIFPGIKGPPSFPTEVITKPITYKNNTIIFYKNGTISSGTLYIVDNYYKKQYAITTSVSAIAYLRLYQYATGKWKLL